MHSALLTLMQPQKKLSQNDEQGIFQVTLQQYANNGQHLSPLKANIPATRKAEVGQKPSSVSSIQTLPLFSFPMGNGGPMPNRLSGQPSPVIQQSNMMEAMREAQLAQQRAMRSNAVRAALSALSNQIRPLVTGKINCVQQAGNDIECVPAQTEKNFTLLTHFFDLVLEARSLGMVENPVRMDFGPELEVSITLLP